MDERKKVWFLLPIVAVGYMGKKKKWFEEIEEVDDEP